MIMTKNDIITEIYEKGIAEKMCNSFRPFIDEREFAQEMILILLEMDDDKLFRLYNNKELDKYYASVCYYQVIRDNSKFNKKMENNLDKISFDLEKYELQDEDDV